MSRSSMATATQLLIATLLGSAASAASDAQSTVAVAATDLRGAPRELLTLRTTDCTDLETAAFDRLCGGKHRETRCCPGEQQCYISNEYTWRCADEADAGGRTVAFRQTGHVDDIERDDDRRREARTRSERTRVPRRARGVRQRAPQEVIDTAEDVVEADPEVQAAEEQLMDYEDADNAADYADQINHEEVDDLIEDTLRAHPSDFEAVDFDDMVGLRMQDEPGGDGGDDDEEEPEEETTETKADPEVEPEAEPGAEAEPEPVEETKAEPEEAPEEPEEEVPEDPAEPEREEELAAAEVPEEELEEEEVATIELPEMPEVLGGGGSGGDSGGEAAGGSCGGESQAPCDGDTCNAGLVFYAPASICTPCGGEYEFCCDEGGDWSCSSDLECRTLPNPFDNNSEGRPLGLARLCV